jgi:hypothetical protein
LVLRSCTRKPRPPLAFPHRTPYEQHSPKSLQGCATRPLYFIISLMSSLSMRALHRSRAQHYLHSCRACLGLKSVSTLTQLASTCKSFLLRLPRVQVRLEVDPAENYYGRCAFRPVTLRGRLPSGTLPVASGAAPATAVDQRHWAALQCPLFGGPTKDIAFCYSCQNASEAE